MAELHLSHIEIEQELALLERSVRVSGTTSDGRTLVFEMKARNLGQEGICSGAALIDGEVVLELDAVSYDRGPGATASLRVRTTEVSYFIEASTDGSDLHFRTTIDQQDPMTAFVSADGQLEGDIPDLDEILGPERTRELAPLQPLVLIANEIIIQGPANRPRRPRWKRLFKRAGCAMAGTAIGLAICAGTAGFGCAAGTVVAVGAATMCDEFVSE